MRQRRPVRTPNAIPQPPFGQVPRGYEPIKVISDDQVETIHLAALKLLATQGMRVLNVTTFAARGRRSRGRWSIPTPA